LPAETAVFPKAPADPDGTLDPEPVVLFELSSIEPMLKRSRPNFMRNLVHDAGAALAISRRGLRDLQPFEGA